MNLKCKLKKLNETILNVSYAVSQKSTILALEGILLVCKDNKLELTGYNLELGIIKTIEVESLEDGQIVLNSKLFGDIIRKMPGEEISISVDDKNIVFIKSEKSEFTLVGISAQEFPEIPIINETKSFYIDSTILKKMLSQTSFAISTNEQNPIYTGSLFNVENTSITIVSVDGYRLAIRKEIININNEFSFIVPGETLKEIQKLIKDEKEENQIKISFSDKHIIFEIYDYLVVSRLLEGQFIDYKNIIKSEDITTTIINPKDLIKSIERVSIMINDRFKSPVKCVVEKKLINLSCSTTLGNVIDEIEIETQGKELTIGFNNKYMLDALKVCESDKVKLSFGNSDNPIKILPNDGGDSFLFLVLPVRLKND